MRHKMLSRFVAPSVTKRKVLKVDGGASMPELIQAWVQATALGQNANLPSLLTRGDDLAGLSTWLAAS